MWIVTNTTPYAADRSWVQDKDGNKIWLVVVKGTFDIHPDGSTVLSDEQVPVFTLPEAFGEFGQSSLRYESDLLGVKTATDVLVHGTAWAPAGRTTSVDVALEVGSIRKRLRVSGDRFWVRSITGGVTPSAAQPFESIPMVFERSYGGWDRSASSPAEHRLESRNPVGTGFAVRVDACRDQRLPNIEHPDQLITSWKDRPAPAGMNAVDCSWSPRRELAGTYDERWRRERFPLWAEDFDSRYHHCAPVDQQVNGFLRGGETVRLTNLSPGGEMTFQLPKIFPFFQTRFGRERVEHRPQLCTVVIEPDRPRVLVAWQTSIVCNDRVDELDKTIVSEKRFI